MLPSSPLTFPDPRNGRLLGERPHFPPAQQLPNGKAASFPPLLFLLHNEAAKGRFHPATSRQKCPLLNGGVM